MSNFHVGQKVVCIDDSEGRGRGLNLHRLIKGDVYTICGIGLFPDGLVGVVIQEFGKCGADPEQPDWLARRFRPVVERKTDISIFRRLLAPTSKAPVNVE